MADLGPGDEFTKVVIVLQGGTTTISVQRHDTDPRWMTTRDLGIEDATAHIPQFLAQAEKEWTLDPRYGTAEKPSTAPPKPPKPQNNSGNTNNAKQTALFT